MSMSVSWSKVPLSTSTEVQTPWTTRDLPGVLNRGWTSARLRKKSPSRAMAKVTRADIMIVPFTAPKVEIRIAAAMIAPPRFPRKLWAASMATMYPPPPASEALYRWAISETGRTYR